MICNSYWISFNKYSRETSQYFWFILLILYLSLFVCFYAYYIIACIHSFAYSIQVILFWIVIYLRYEICSKQVCIVSAYSQNAQSRQQFKQTLDKTERSSNQEWTIQIYLATLATQGTWQRPRQKHTQKLQHSTPKRCNKGLTIRILKRYLVFLNRRRTYNTMAKGKWTKWHTKIYKTYT